ncbi:MULTISPECIES: fructosamine kinase family protein [unclassified Agrococcus]|uniref:fructosamine kinase family protein n=1 Tax=unclassified Agrococcus TaxID=2615065 RepID=UPI003620DF3E
MTFTKRARGGADAAAWEIASLRWLAEAETVGGARVARVIRREGATIELERLEPARPTRADAEAFGRALAATHAAGADAWHAPPPGCDGVGWIGRQHQGMTPTASWGEGFAEQRIRPFVRAAVDAGHLDAAGARVVERVCDAIAAGDHDDDRAPARIHGDLWSGNVLWTATGAVVIDPAAHGGHPLTDLAMLALFGLPHLDVVLDAHADAAGLAPGWRDLLGLHQLHPLAVHAVSHGASYGAELVAVARRYA